MPIWWVGKTKEERRAYMKTLTDLRREKSKYKLYPHSAKRTEEYKNMLNLIYGKECYLCRFNGRLELHHLWYTEDMPYKNTGRENNLRKIEAIQHPERFVRLCKVCHSAITLVEKKGLIILEGIEFIIMSSKNKSPIQEKLVDLYAK